MKKINQEEAKRQREKLKQQKEKELIEQFFTPGNSVERTLQASDEEVLAKAIQNLLKKDTLH